jgi:GMP synthase-like glutamine amidotransferase
MRFGILKAATLSRRAQARVGDLENLYTDLLALPGQQWEAFDALHGQLPPRVADFDGLVVTGSAASVTDPDPWIVDLLQTLREAHARQVPLLGICFGLQAVTQALGGQVDRNPAGWDIGTTELELTEAGRRWQPLAAAPRPLRILKTHADIAVRLPPGSVVLARSPRVPVEVYSLGERVLCLQGHPELDAEIVGELIDKRERNGLLDSQRAEEGRISLQLPPQRAFLQGWLQTFLREGRVPAAA